MVAKIASGKNIRGALSYNENKVEESKAELLVAVNYPKECAQLSFSEKFQRLQYQADLNERIQHRCVHISLNFDPSEKFSQEKMQAIAVTYMQRIGFGEQPFLVYNHNDAAHPHLHIVTTSIKGDGSPIRLHNNWEDSERARKSIEQDFGLVPAQGRKKNELYTLKPADLRKALYGKSETKSSISNIVRAVVRNYKFTSLAQLNAVLLQYNVIADRGEKESRMYEKKGLVYSLVDEKGKRVGVPIKASSIYLKPTLSFLEREFPKKEIIREKYEERLRMVVDDVLRVGGVDRISFAEALEKHGVHAIFRENEAGNTYGVTYVDNKTCCVFNGSDLGKAYSAKGVLERLSGNSVRDSIEVARNRKFVTQALNDLNFKQGFRHAMADWTAKGLYIGVKVAADGSISYTAGHYKTHLENHIPLNKKFSAYLQVNGYTKKCSEWLRIGIDEELAKVAGEISRIVIETVQAVIEAALQPVHDKEFIDYHWLRKSNKDKRKRRR